MKSIQRLSVLWVLLAMLSSGACSSASPGTEGSNDVPFLWDNANIYFLLTDRFMDGDPSNNLNFDRSAETALMRGFQGGDIAGVIQKLKDGYFDDLIGISLWLTPWFEQIKGSTDEGTGRTYGYHGYWISDWTSMDPNSGTEEELAELIQTAHDHGIRILMDVIINHTGPVTDLDPAWPDEWVRLSPRCTYENYETTVTCTLVENLPDIRTESDQEVELPPALLEKWEKEGRLEKELAELDAFFQATGYPRAPRYYLIKWLSDYVRKYGIDGYRLDTAKHIEEGVWKELFTEASTAFFEWKKENPDKSLDHNEFYMVGEVYNYGISAGRLFNFGDVEVDFFAEDIHSLINFEFKYNAGESYEELFSSYSRILHNELKDKGIVNYLTSHDDGGPFDKERKKTFEAGTKLLLSPGACQIYYGDESSRNLIIPGASGDATLRGPMNWKEIDQNSSRNDVVIGDLIDHYRKLGQFRKDHPSVGAGKHKMISSKPYFFTREYSQEGYADKVLVGLDLKKGELCLDVSDFYEDGTKLFDYYSESYTEVSRGKIKVDSDAGIILLGIK